MKRTATVKESNEIDICKRYGFRHAIDCHQTECERYSDAECGFAHMVNCRNSKCENYTRAIKWKRKANQKNTSA